MPKGRGPSPKGRMTGITIRLPDDLRDFYMGRSNMSAEMRLALRTHMDKQLSNMG